MVKARSGLSIISIGRGVAVVGTSPRNPLSVDIVVRAHTARARLQWHVAGRIGGTWITP